MLLNKTLVGLILASHSGAPFLAGPERLILSRAGIARQIFPFLLNVRGFHVNLCASRHYLSPIIAFQSTMTMECEKLPSITPDRHGIMELTCVVNSTAEHAYSFPVRSGMA
jgi:hypothetical protein